MPSTTNPAGLDAAQVDALLPKPATSMPPGVSDVGALGTVPQRFAMENHTHASKARKDRLQCAADGTLTWTYSTPFTNGVVPRIVAVAETTSGVTDVINVQVEGTPTNTQAVLRVTRTNRSTVALLGLTILSLPAQPGVTWVHCVALEP